MSEGDKWSKSPRKECYFCGDPQYMEFKTIDGYKIPLCKSDECLFIARQSWEEKHESIE